MQPDPRCPHSRSPCTFPCSCCASCGSLCPLRRSGRTQRRCLPGAFRVGRADIRRTAPAPPAASGPRTPIRPSPPPVRPKPPWRPDPSPSPCRQSPTSPKLIQIPPRPALRHTRDLGYPPPPSTHPKTGQNTPRVTSRVFWKKLLLRARRPLKTPPTPPASPHPLQAPPPVTCPMPRGPASPSPSRLWADPPCRWPLPRRGRSGRPKLGISLKKIRPNRLSPARPLWGRAGERRFPPSPPRLCGPRPPRRPCTLSPRSSTVTPESRS